MSDTHSKRTVNAWETHPDAGNPTSWTASKWGAWELTCINCGTFYILTAPTLLRRCHCPVCCCEQELEP